MSNVEELRYSAIALIRIFRSLDMKARPLEVNESVDLLRLPYVERQDSQLMITVRHVEQCVFANSKDGYRLYR